MAPTKPLIAWYQAVLVPSDTPLIDSGGMADGGNWVDSRALQISVDDIGFRQSVVAVERLRTYHGQPLSVPQHVVRWRRTIDHLAIPIEVDEAVIDERIKRLIEHNRDWCHQVGDFGITMLATPGVATDRSQPIQMIHLNPLDSVKIHKHRTAGQPLVITDVHQPPAQCWPRDIKVRCRLHYYLADRMAQQVDADAVGLLVDADGSITETSVASLAICSRGKIVSPPPEQVLSGITQELVSKIALENHFTWSYAPLYPADVREADEVWLMGTDGGLWFVNRVDGIMIGDGRAGTIYRRVLTGFDAAVVPAATGA
jgi:branched-chain amino acid aminotransferase